jgi:Uma2 family endonuclease
MTQPLEWPSRPPSSADLVCDDGEPMETWRHRAQMTVLIESLEHAWRDRDDFYVSGNMFFYFSETQARRNDFRGPDVFVVMNTTRRERRAWVVWEEDGQVPDVIIELLSDKTERVDRGDKMRLYARLKVGEYFLFDPFTAVFEGYELDVLHARYTKKIPDGHGRLRCERLGLSLGPIPSTLWKVEAPWLRWLGDDGSALAMPSEDANREAERANAEAERANAEAKRANAEAKRSEAETERAAVEAERARAAEERAAAEAERANQLAAEIEALRRRLSRRTTTS